MSDRPGWGAMLPTYNIPETFGNAVSYEGQLHWFLENWNDVAEYANALEQPTVTVGNVSTPESNDMPPSVTGVTEGTDLTLNFTLPDKMIKPLGAWSASVDYESLSLVNDGSGNTYIAKAPSPAGTPLTNTAIWMQVGVSSANYLPLTGGRLTGPLVMEGADIDIDTNGVSSGVAPSQNVSGQALTFRDSNNMITALIRNIFYANGNECLHIDFRRGAGGAVRNEIELGARQDGTPYVAVNNVGAWKNALGFASSSGDTFTGDLTMDRHNVYAVSDVTSGTPPVGQNVSGTGITFYDRNGATLGFVHPIAYQNGTETILIDMRRIIDGVTYRNYIELGIKADGSPYVNLSQPAAWRTALGIS